MTVTVKDVDVNRIIKVLTEAHHELTLVDGLYATNRELKGDDVLLIDNTDTTLVIERLLYDLQLSPVVKDTIADHKLNMLKLENKSLMSELRMTYRILDMIVNDYNNDGIGATRIEELCNDLGKFLQYHTLDEEAHNV